MWYYADKFKSRWYSRLADTPQLEFVSVEQIVATEPEDQDCVIEQLLVRGAISFLTAKIKAGKTTFLGYLLKCIVQEREAIGLRTRPGKILYCTEEGPRTFRTFLKRIGLEEATGLIDVLFLNKVASDLLWPSTVKGVLSHALRTNAVAVVFDTLPRWAKIKPEQENDAGAATQAMEPLEVLRAANLAILAVFHERKSGGDVSDASRGSSAFGGAADVLLLLTNPDTNGHPNRRRLQSMGRLDDPAEWTIDLQEGEYVVQSTSAVVERGMAEARFLELTSARTTAQLEEELGISRTTIERMLKGLEDQGLATKTGSGGRGKPYLWLPTAAPLTSSLDAMLYLHHQ